MNSRVPRINESWFIPAQQPRESGETGLVEALLDVGRPLVLLDLGEGRMGFAHEGVLHLGTRPSATAGATRACRVLAHVPALPPQALGDPAFVQAHGVQFACLSGAMARGIASVDLVEAMGRAGFMGFFGAGGLSPDRVEAAVDALQARIPDLPYGFNLLHSPSEPELEDRIVDLYLRRGVRRVCAAAYLALTLPVVRYRFTGITRDRDGRIVTPHHVFAKVSRSEVARRFLSPPPEEMLRALVEQGVLTAAQAEMAATLPVAADLTAEADSGGHTDNRASLALVPSMLALRDEMQARHRYEQPLRVGAAGGIATPAAAAAAFAMGAAYVMTGSVNQACVESGSCDAVRQMLAQVSQADVTMAPAADMFEMGVRVQVLKWGTMFPVRARKLYDLYRAHDSLEALPPAERTVLERDFFRSSLEDEWNRTRAFFTRRDPRQVERAEREPHHKMALVFRSYLGQASNWANQGDPTRKVDYQIWCGPAMGAFNEWARGTFLERLEERRVATVALNFMMGAAVLTRAMALRSQGVALPGKALSFSPMPAEEIRERLRSPESPNNSLEEAALAAPHP